MPKLRFIQDNRENNFTSSSGPNEAPYTKIFFGTQPRITHLQLMRSTGQKRLSQTNYNSKRTTWLISDGAMNTSLTEKKKRFQNKS